MRRWFCLQCAVLVFVFACALGQQIRACYNNSCCQQGSYKELNNSRRSERSQWKSGQTPLCDKDYVTVTGWYRFTSFVGKKMPTYKVDMNRCGTRFPIWLNGTHPTMPTDPVVNIKACINIMGRNGGCLRHFTVGVKRSPKDFFVYYLKKITRCPTAYCAGQGQPCPYGQTGTSLRTCSGTCFNRINNFSCVCDVGYTGRHCDVVITRCSNDSCYPGVPCMDKTVPISCGPCPSGFRGNGKSCKDIDDCDNHTCANGASCVDGINRYSCLCTTGFIGRYCEIDIDDCINNTCANGASCVDGINSYSCNCAAGFTGAYCNKDIDECASGPCFNGGSCVDGVNGYLCNCSRGFTGKRCGTNIDDCVSHTCINGGSCVDGVNSYSCSCVNGYSGDRCEKGSSTGLILFHLLVPVQR